MALICSFIFTCATYKPTHDPVCRSGASRSLRLLALFMDSEFHLPKLRRDTGMTLSTEFIHDLKNRFTGDLRLDLASKVLYSTDASSYRIEPLGVGIPKTQEDLQTAVELAAKYKFPILPEGRGLRLRGRRLARRKFWIVPAMFDSIIEIDS